AFLLSTALESPDDESKQTLAIQGSYRNSTSEAWSEFDISIPLSDGRLTQLRPIEESDIVLRTDETPEAELYVVFERHPLSAFVGVSPSELSEAEFAWQIFSNTLHTSHAYYQLAQPY
ncbi:MAG: hypothetical protein AAFY60_12330, partial [Myxococcota bacterium]